ncbi:MAG: hypothetical protein MUC92_03525 [Fimbriimonadaceae bacterium]|nr:hypothetical protein [Fimbriimonadaceae bacterium]
MPLDPADLNRALILSYAAAHSAEAGDDVECLALIVERGTVLTQLEGTALTPDMRAVLIQIQETDRKISSALADLQSQLAGELVRVFYDKRGIRGYGQPGTSGILDKTG